MGNESTTWQCRIEKILFPCHKALNAYDEIMGYVDLFIGWLWQKIGGPFMTKSHFKNGTKRGFLGILDFILVNRCVSWNLSSEISGIMLEKVDNSYCRVYIAEKCWIG